MMCVVVWYPVTSVSSAADETVAVVQAVDPNNDPPKHAKNDKGPGRPKNPGPPKHAKDGRGGPPPHANDGGNGGGNPPNNPPGNPPGHNNPPPNNNHNPPGHQNNPGNNNNPKKFKGNGKPVRSQPNVPNKTRDIINRLEEQVDRCRTRQPVLPPDKIDEDDDPRKKPDLVDFGDDDLTVVEAGIGILSIIGLVGIILLTMYSGYVMGYKDNEKAETSFMRALLERAKLRNH